MFRIASSPRGVAAPITATILLAATTCGCDSPPPDERLAGVPLTEELRPAVEASRRSLRLGVTGDPVVRAELARYLELAAMLSRNDRRAAAEDSLYTLWSRDLDGILWPDLVAFNRNRFSDLARLQSLFEHPEFPDSSTALGAYLREWRRIGPRPDGSGYAVARNARAELTPFQDVWFGLRLARFVRQSGNADEAARIAIETLPAARRVGGWRLESKAWTEVSRTLAATADLDGALHAAVLAEDLAIDEFSVLEARFQRADVLAERRDVEPALALYEVCVAEALDSGFGSLAGDVLNRAGIFTSTVGRYEEGLAVYQRALAVAIADGDSLNVPRHLANIGRRYLILGELDSCRVYLEEAEQWIRAHPDPSNLARFPLFQAEYRAQIGDFEAVDSLHALAAEITPSSSPIHELAELHLEVIRQGTESGRPGRVYRSLSHLDSLRTRLRSSFADRNELFDLDLAVADFLGRQGVFVRAAKALDRAEMSLLSRPDPARTWQLTAARGHLARRRDDATAAESAYVACISMSRGLDGEDRLALSQLWLASHHLEQGHLDAATSIMDAGPAARFDRRFRTRLSAALLRAAVDSRAGRFRAARKGLERARELCPPTSATDLLVRLDLETGRALAGLGKTREARESFARARDRLLTDRRSFRVGNEIFLDRDLRRELAEAMLDVALPRSRPQLKGEEASAALRDVAGLLPAWRASRDITTRRLAELQILFFAGAGSTYRWTVRAGEVTLQRLPGEDM
ncbi:MAG TPA: hypothetical protein VKU85_12810, partial [bacterium]|nr:hypothetical protein [bacterium]